MKRLNIYTIAILFISFYFLQLFITIAFFIPSPYEENGFIQKDDSVATKSTDSKDVDMKNEEDIIITNDSLKVKQSPKITTTTNEEKQKHPPILTAYLQTSSSQLEKHEFPQANQYIQNDVNNNKNTILHPFPIIDDYPDGDSFLPWIHDLHPSADGSTVKIYAQNRRRCHTGTGNEGMMKELEGQIALFQPIPVASYHGYGNDSNNNDEITHFRVSSYEDADSNSKETRFICRFKDINAGKSWQTFSTYPFNYEYISWRKDMNGMFQREGKEMGQFWLSSLQFDCPVPEDIKRVNNGVWSYNNLYLDIITIRTPVRFGEKEFFFHEGHGGPMNFDIYKEWGKELFIPPIEKSTRWENIYINPMIFPREKKAIDGDLPWNGKNDVVIVGDDKNNGQKKKKPFQLVACTWTSASHNRRGDKATVGDGKERLLEWIAFHLLVGFDHIVVYDNSAANTNETTLKDVTDRFGANVVTRVEWPSKICNNNRPAHNDPGERSSQYAAEASCRGRFASYTDWMSFLDPDEYLVPMGNFNSWKEILDQVNKEGKKILKFRSTRARPLPNLMKPVYHSVELDKCPTLAEVNGDELRKSSCLVRSQKYTFLQTYNCEYIKSPKPDRFQRAMKQLYMPEYVLSHFVHYSTVTVDLARTKDQTEPGKYKTYARTSDPRTERFIHEINEGVLVHAKSIMPEEAVPRNARCKFKVHPGCLVGIPCSDDLPFDDKTHQDGFIDKDGRFCNCWKNQKLEKLWIPLLEDSLKKLR